MHIDPWLAEPQLGNNLPNQISASVQPFQIAFFSDGYEAAIESTAAISTKGFSIKYFQTAC